jgi:hypothetical protein
VATATTAGRFYIPLPVTMRAEPTLIATASDWEMSDGANAATACSSLSLIDGQAGLNYVGLLTGAASGLTQYRPYVLRAGIGKILMLSAEF